VPDPHKAQIMQLSIMSTVAGSSEK